MDDSPVIIVPPIVLNVTTRMAWRDDACVRLAPLALRQRVARPAVPSMDVSLQPRSRGQLAPWPSVTNPAGAFFFGGAA